MLRDSASISSEANSADTCSSQACQARDVATRQRLSNAYTIRDNPKRLSCRRVPADAAHRFHPSNTRCADLNDRCSTTDDTRALYMLSRSRIACCLSRSLPCASTSWDTYRTHVCHKRDKSARQRRSNTRAKRDNANCLLRRLDSASAVRCFHRFTLNHYELLF